MPVLFWLAGFVGATVTLLVNVVLACALFVLSAHLFSLGQDDAEVPGYILRGLAAIWLWAAVWRYLKHGVLQRPKPVPSRDKVKTTGKDAALASVGCLASIGAVVATALVVGPWADWVYQGLVGSGPTHPARQVLTRVLDGAHVMAQDPESYVGYVVAIVLALTILRVIAAAGSRRPSTRPAQQTRNTRRGQHREPEAAPTTTTATTTRPASPGPTSAPRTSNAGRTIDDPMLGVLRRDDSVGGWRLVNPRSDVGGLVIASDGEPTSAQMDTARSLVQRSFEALLRASEAARPAAQANGIGLPRFTVVDTRVGEVKGGHPTVTMRLSCEGDAARVYEVVSTDGMQTFSL